MTQESSQFNSGGEASSSKTAWKFIIAFLAVILVTGGGWWIWNNYLSTEAKQRRAAQENYERLYKGLVTDFEEAMKADTWGGKTPQETLDLFVDALRKGDIELASKYFHIETNVNDPDYLTKRKWEEGLKKAKEEGRIPQILEVITSANPSKRDISDNVFWYEVIGEDGIVDYSIILRLNTRSGVWKIESL